jgi:hypothetical protein
MRFHPPRTIVALLILAVAGVGVVVTGGSPAGAIGAPYAVAVGGCETQYWVSPFPPIIAAYLSVQVYNLPSSADGPNNGGASNTFFEAAPSGYLLGGRNAIPVTGGTGQSVSTELSGPNPITVQVQYLAPDGTLASLPVMTVNLPPLSACGSENVTSTSSPPTSGTAPIVAMVSTVDNKGYWFAGADGRVYAFGDALSYPADGSFNFGPPALNAPIVGMAATPTGNGYWLVASDGGIFSYGDANFYGSTGAMHLNKPIVGMAATPTGNGYWLVASDGGVFAFGDARFHGSMGGSHLNQPVVGMAADNATGGYWLVASDGGIFSFNAPFEGSTGSIRLNRPIVGMEAASNGSGYRFVAADGGVFCFNLPFSGSTGSLHLDQPVVGMGAAGNDGYWLAAKDGGVFSFSAPFYGSVG